MEAACVTRRLLGYRHLVMEEGRRRRRRRRKDRRTDEKMKGKGRSDSYYVLCLFAYE